MLWFTGILPQIMKINPSLSYARHQYQKDHAMEELEHVENAMATYKTSGGGNALRAESRRLKVVPWYELAEVCRAPLFENQSG
ncbi:unnamed protein product [Phytophthora fragariaefolia]|uniref:Unnamed protein product n=1 Tax=Phytophthora fragariaefolia TaxID=1490495 RepID=A0A9W6WWN1_9STRA|nr:unnamed protein product [Phytophthora fragariaefolia]